jgi:hypothetical protein
MAIYLALGDSISIDDYTGVTGGGAASQLARKLGLDLVDLTHDGNTTQGVLADLCLRRLDQIAERLQPLGARVVVNTVYDPSDGDNDIGRRELGLSRLATMVLRRRLNTLNAVSRSWRASAASCSPISSGSATGTALYRTSRGFFVIEPNLAAATASRNRALRTDQPPDGTSATASTSTWISGHTIAAGTRSMPAGSCVIVSFCTAT